MPLGLFGGLEVLPALAVPCGLASAASFVCVVIVSSFIANPHGREGAGMMPFGLLGGLEVLPALACRADWLQPPHSFLSSSIRR